MYYRIYGNKNGESSGYIDDISSDDCDAACHDYQIDREGGGYSHGGGEKEQE